GAYSKNKAVNVWMGRTLLLLGGFPYNWKLQHNLLHHTYTNIQTIDEDIRDRLALRFSPYTMLRKYHRLQHAYAFFFYGLMTFYWALFKDFVQLFKFKEKGVNTLSKKENIIFFFQILLHKVVYLSLILGLPMWVGGFAFWQVFLGFFAMHFVA